MKKMTNKEFWAVLEKAEAYTARSYEDILNSLACLMDHQEDKMRKAGCEAAANRLLHQLCIITEELESRGYYDELKKDFSRDIVTGMKEN